MERGLKDILRQRICTDSKYYFSFCWEFFFSGSPGLPVCQSCVSVNLSFFFSITHHSHCILGHKKPPINHYCHIIFSLVYYYKICCAFFFCSRWEWQFHGGRVQKKNNKKHPPAKVFKDCHHSSGSSVKLIVIYSSIKIHCRSNSTNCLSFYS